MSKDLVSVKKLSLSSPTKHPDILGFQTLVTELSRDRIDFF